MSSSLSPNVSLTLILPIKCVQPGIKSTRCRRQVNSLNICQSLRGVNITEQQSVSKKQPQQAKWGRDALISDSMSQRVQGVAADRAHIPNGCAPRLLQWMEKNETKAGERNAAKAPGRALGVIDWNDVRFKWSPWEIGTYVGWCHCSQSRLSIEHSS